MFELRSTLFTYLTVLISTPSHREIRVFRKLTTLTIMAILTSEVLLRPKNPVTKCYPSGIRTQAASDLKSNTFYTNLTCAA